MIARLYKARLLFMCSIKNLLRYKKKKINTRREEQKNTSLIV